MPSTKTVGDYSVAQRGSRDERWETSNKTENRDDAEEDEGEDLDDLKPLPKLPAVAPKLPEPLLELDIGDSLVDTIDTVFLSSAGAGSTSKVGKRASNVLKLSAENDKLKQQLKEMSERLEAAEKRRLALAAQTRSHDNNHHSSNQNGHGRAAPQRETNRF